jgi:hypothetical protein
MTSATQPGAKINGEKCLPVMNKMYWGMRLREVFKDANSDAEAVNAAIKGSQPPGMPDAATIVLKGGTVVVSGPIPPLKIKEQGGSYKFTWGNKDVLLQGGKVTRSSGNPYKAPSRTDHTDYSTIIENNNNTPNIVNTIAAHINDTSKGVAKQLDEKVKGTYKGGMTYFDAGKQIFFPFFTPPAKPFMPSSESDTWGA